MGERKGVNKYYPPDYDPSKGGLNKFQGTHALRERAKKIHLGILVIRFEMPYNIWCDGCGDHIGMGVRYNAEKSKVGMYYTTPVYQFRMKCHLCDNYFVIKTDPANLDYEVVSGARRQERRFDPAENGTVVPDERAKIQRLATDAMYKLEHGADDAGKLKDAKPALEKVERIQDRMWDDFAANKRLRDKFRAGKKAAAAAAARDADLLRRASLDLALSPESPEDRRLAALMRLQDPVGVEERRKRKRATIGARPALGDTAPRTGGFGTPASSGGAGRTAASIGVTIGRSSGGGAATVTSAASGQTDTGAERISSSTTDSGSGESTSTSNPGSAQTASTGCRGSTSAPAPSLPGPADCRTRPPGQTPGDPGPDPSPVTTTRHPGPDPDPGPPDTARSGPVSLVAEYSSTDSE